MTWRIAGIVGVTAIGKTVVGRKVAGKTVVGFIVAGLTVAGLAVVSGVPSADLGAGSRTGAQPPKPEMTRVPQFDNRAVTVWKSIIPPGSQSTLHRHDHGRTVIGIVGGDLTTVAPDGRKTVTRYETGKAYWQDPMPAGQMHRDLNQTNTTIEVMVVEMK